MKKLLINVVEFIKEYSTYNYHSGKRYRRKHKVRKFKESD